MKLNSVKTTLVIGFILLGLANLSVAFLTLVVKSQKYGLADLWHNPDSFAIGTTLIALLCFGVAYWFSQK
jgi:hypothetical protein